MMDEMEEIVRKTDLPFDLCDEDGLRFDLEPQLFVRLDQAPILWTVLGLAYFRPRFAYLGIAISAVGSAQRFKQALSRWLDVERQLLLERIEARANHGGETLEYRFLQAVVHGDLVQGDKVVRLLEHRQRTGLRRV